MPAHRRASGATRRRLSGLVFLLVLASLVGLSVAVYDKAFVRVVHVTLEADRIGNQLKKTADVKVRGLPVGEVRGVRSNGAVASIDLALDPGKVDLIPANVSARLLPKTLFGEKYVELVPPAQPARRHLADGDVIPQDRSRTAIELERVLDDVLPLLRTIRPEQLNATLGALATALEGRGDRIGQNLVRVDDYLRQLNPRLPVIRQDVSAFADVASTYADAAPDLLAVLRNSVTTSRTLVEKQQDLLAFLQGTAGFANTGTRFFQANGDRLIRLADVSRPTLSLLARYSPEYPCLAKALVAWQPRIEQAMGGGYNGLHITLEVIRSRPAYQPGEEPAYLARKGPDCRGLPTPQVPDRGERIPDGSSGPLPPSSGQARAVPTALVDGVSSPAGTATEAGFVRPIVAPAMGVAEDDVPDIAALLFAPLARGTAVTLS